MGDTILITGATGQISSAIIPHVKATGATVRALVRNRNKVENLAGDGVVFVEGDLGLPRSLRPAFEGVDTLWLLTAVTPRAPEHHSNALQAAREAGVKRVVRLSSNDGAKPCVSALNSRLMAISDAELKASGIPYTIIRPHFFMQNLLIAAQTVAAEGAIYMALGNARIPMIDARDISEAAARLLSSRGHENKEYTLSGPCAVSVDDVANALSTELKKAVRYVPISVESADQAMQQLGFDAWIRTLLSDYFEAYSTSSAGDATDDFQKIVGRPPRGIEQFAHDFAGAFRGEMSPEVAAAMSSLRPAS
jgi:uncharacterized protein YbjT (DUF2867 family)